MPRYNSILSPQCWVISFCLLMLCGCSPISGDTLWTIVSLPEGKLDSLHKVEREVLIIEGRRSHYLDIFIRHDNRTEQMQIPLVWQVYKHEELLYSDTLNIDLAKKAGEWIGQELITHEVVTMSPQATYIERAGLYRLVLYVPSEVTVQGMQTIGFKLKRKD